MKAKFLFLTLASVMIAFSCAKQENQGPDDTGNTDGKIRVEISAGSEGVKTSLGEAVDGVRAISWVKDDAIRIIYGDNSSDFVIARASASGATTTFVAEVPVSATTLYAVYPADAYEGIDNGQITVKVPNWQDGAFASANIAVARTTVEELSFAFKNVCGYVLMDLKNNNIRKVTLNKEGAALAGKMAVSFNNEGGIVMGEATETSAEVSAYFTEPGRCVISVLPGLSFADGVGVTFADANGDYISSTRLRNDFTLTRGGILTAQNIDDAISINYFATVSGNGTKDGSSWENAWGAEELKTFLETENPDYSDKARSASINIAVAAGTYAYTTGIPIKTKGRAMRMTGGYAAENPAGSIVDPVANATIFTSTGTGNFMSLEAQDTCTFSGLTFSGHKGSGTGRGAFYVRSKANPTLCTFSNCYFKNNTNTGVGAALISTTTGTLEIRSCTFEGNTAGGGPAVNTESDNVVMSDCIFKNNICTKYADSQDGGALKIGNGKFKATNCTFTGNSIAADAYGSGAAVWVASAGTDSVQFNSCTFEKNLVKNPVGKGGALYISNGQNSHFTNCTFAQNEVTDTSATAFGGAVMIGNANNKYGDHNITATFNDCTFDNNKVYRQANALDRTGAGAIYLSQGKDVQTICNLNNCTIKNHVVDAMYGAAIFAQSGTLNIHGGEISKNDARRIDENTTAASYGMIHIVYADVALTGNTVIKDNYTQSGGTAIFIPLGSTSKFSATGTSFENNQTVGGGGGAVRLAIASDNEIVFKQCTFKNNKNANSGGAIVIYRDQDVKVENCTFEGNTVTNMGGAIYVGGEQGSTNTLTVINSTFKSNYGYNGGGAIEVSNNGNSLISGTSNYNYCKANMNISGCTFLENNSVGYGGCIDSRTSGTVNITNSTFEGNYTTATGGTGCGGAISLKYGQTNVVDAALRGKVNISGCTFTNNHTANGNGNGKGRGGAIAMTAASSGASFMDVRINNCGFFGNYATQGGAFMIHDNQTTPGTTLFVNNCILDGNYCYFRNAVAVAIWYAKNFGINNTTLKNCYTTSSQAVANCPWINIAGYKATVSNVTMIGQNQLKSNDTGDYTPNPAGSAALLRFEQTAKNDIYNLINNVIATTKDWCNSIAGTSATNACTMNLYSNKLSAVGNNITASNTDAFNGTNYKGTAEYFGGLSYTTNSSAPAYTNTYWAWNGTLATGTPTTMNTLSDVNAKIQAADADFYAWLQSVGGLNVDQRGTTRTANTWPGAYQAN